MVSVVGQRTELSSLWYPENEGVRESFGSMTRPHSSVEFVYAAQDRQLKVGDSTRGNDQWLVVPLLPDYRQSGRWEGTRSLRKATAICGMGTSLFRRRPLWLWPGRV